MLAKPFMYLIFVVSSLIVFFDTFMILSDGNGAKMQGLLLVVVFFGSDMMMSGGVIYLMTHQEQAAYELPLRGAQYVLITDKQLFDLQTSQVQMQQPVVVRDHTQMLI